MLRSGASDSMEICQTGRMRELGGVVTVPKVGKGRGLVERVILFMGEGRDIKGNGNSTCARNVELFLPSSPTPRQLYHCTEGKSSGPVYGLPHIPRSYRY